MKRTLIALPVMLLVLSSVIAPFGTEHCRQRDSSGIRCPPAKRKDLACLVNALETCNNDNFPVVEFLFNTIRLDLCYPGFGMNGVGHQADLSARKADGFLAKRINRHSHQADTYLFASG